MRDKKRIKRILTLIGELWNFNKDQRFGQLLINIGVAEDNLTLWNNEDDLLENYLLKLKERKEKINNQSNERGKKI